MTSPASPSVQVIGMNIESLRGLINGQRGAEHQVFLFVLPALPPPGQHRETSPAEIANTAQRMHEEENAGSPCAKYLKLCIDLTTGLFKVVFKIIGIPLLFLGGALLIYGIIQSSAILLTTLSLAELIKCEAIIAMVIGLLFFSLGTHMVQGKDLPGSLSDLLYMPLPFITKQNT